MWTYMVTYNVFYINVWLNLAYQQVQFCFQLLSVSQQECNITLSLSTWSYLLSNSSESQSESWNTLYSLNSTLQSVGARLGDFEVLGRWIEETTLNNSITLEGLFVYP